MRDLRIALVVISASFCSPTINAADLFLTCEELEAARDEPVTISVKYDSHDARDLVWSISGDKMHLEFIFRVVGETRAAKALSLCRREDVLDIEIIGDTEKDSTLHRLLEVWRAYHYAIGGRFEIAALNFSQGVRTAALHKGISGERTMAEALEAVARRAAPVFVAAGNFGTLGLSEYASGASVFPVVATENNGRRIFPPSSRPGGGDDPGRMFLFADGAPRAQSEIDNVDEACTTTEHLTIGQMLAPDEAGIDDGGSSFATFAATSTACPVHQYLEIVNAYLSSTDVVGEAQLDPFIAYYVDNPVSRECPSLLNRLADRRRKYAPIYVLSIQQKSRLQDFFFGNSVEFNLRFSPRLLEAFYRSLPSRRLSREFSGSQRYVDMTVVLDHLREMTISDWLDIGANKRSLYFGRWRNTAKRDPAPVLDSETIDRISSYCHGASLFVVLPDIPPSTF